MVENRNFVNYLEILKRDIHNFVQRIPFLLDNYLPEEQMLGFENDFEFIRGWTIGQLHSDSISLFRETFGRNPSKEEYNSILQTIMKYNYDIQSQIKSYCFKTNKF